MTYREAYKALLTCMCNEISCTYCIMRDIPDCMERVHEKCLESLEFSINCIEYTNLKSYIDFLEYKKRLALINFMNSKDKNGEDYYKHEYHELRRMIQRMEMIRNERDE